MNDEGVSRTAPATTGLLFIGLEFGPYFPMPYTYIYASGCLEILREVYTQC